MNLLIRVFATVLLAAPGCSQDSANNDDGSGGGSSSSDSGTSTGGTANSTGAGGGDVFDDTSCDRAPCEGFSLGGISYAACCLPQADACGVAVGSTCVDRTAFAPPSRDGGGTGIGFDLGDPETVVLDPACPALTMVMGRAVNLPGCCDVTGVCGYSTAGIGATSGFDIPEMCASPDDPIGAFLASSDPPVPCDYPADAGASLQDGG